MVTDKPGWHPTCGQPLAHSNKGLSWIDFMKTTNARERKKATLEIIFKNWDMQHTPWNTKDQEILLDLNNKNIDICAITETKKKGKGYHVMIIYCYSVVWIRKKEKNKVLAF